MRLLNRCRTHHTTQPVHINVVSSVALNAACGIAVAALAIDVLTILAGPAHQALLWAASVAYTL